MVSIEPSYKYIPGTFFVNRRAVAPEHIGLVKLPPGQSAGEKLRGLGKAIWKYVPSVLGAVGAAATIGGEITGNKVLSAVGSGASLVGKAAKVYKEVNPDSEIAKASDKYEKAASDTTYVINSLRGKVVAKPAYNKTKKRLMLSPEPVVTSNDMKETIDPGYEDGTKRRRRRTKKLAKKEHHSSRKQSHHKRHTNSK